MHLALDSPKHKMCPSTFNNLHRLIDVTKLHMKPALLPPTDAVSFLLHDSIVGCSLCLWSLGFLLWLYLFVRNPTKLVIPFSPIIQKPLSIEIVSRKRQMCRAGGKAEELREVEAEKEAGLQFHSSWNWGLSHN